MNDKLSPTKSSPNANVKVGDTFRVYRTFRHGGSRYGEYTAVVTKITAKRVYLDDKYFNIDDAARIVRPHYLDYTTYAEPVGSLGGVRLEGN